MQLNDVSALVTGGASGLAAATARTLADRGARVAEVDLNADGASAVATAIGGVPVVADVTQPHQVEAAVGAAAELGPLRVVVNCAGIGWAQRTLARDGTPHDLDVFRKVIEINLVGTFNVIRLAARAMAATDSLADGERGAIVNTASVAGLEGQTGQAAYAASKGGIIGLTLPVARDLAAVGVRVNTICPGLMDTPLMNSASAEVIDALGQSVLFPKRMGTPEEFAGLACELVTNSYMNGATLRLDGGIRFQPK